MPDRFRTPAARQELAAFYRNALLSDVIPFWLRHGLDHEHGGFLTALDRDGTLLDDDKSIWFQGRGAWMMATLFNTMERRPEFLDAARSGVEFLRSHSAAPDGKLYFLVTRDGRPLRMRRYAYSEAFSAIANAAYARAAGDEASHNAAIALFGAYLDYSFTPGQTTPKWEMQTRPMIGIGPLMIGVSIAQELRENLGDVVVQGKTCTQWIDDFITQIERNFVKPDWEVVMEVVAPDGAILDHFDGRQLNPGHAIECVWFLLHEGKLRSERRYIDLGLAMLDWMWKRGWDEEYGGLFYFRDLRGLPVQEYWHDMKFWWPHCEAIIASILAWKLTGDEKYVRMHAAVHDWSFRHFADAEYGEWFGYLHRDGRLSSRLKGNVWKGPFHLPRMLWYCTRLLEEKA